MIILAVLSRALVVTAFANAKGRTQNALEPQSLDISITDVALAIVLHFLLEVTLGNFLSGYNLGCFVWFRLAPVKALRTTGLLVILGVHIVAATHQVTALQLFNHTIAVGAMSASFFLALLISDFCLRNF